MKNLKSILALLLALVMVLSLAACGGNSAEDTKAPAADDTTAAPAGDDDTTAAPADDTTASGLDWLNLGGVYPIVDEGVEKTLSIVLPINDEVIDNYKNVWQYIWTTEVLNINLEVTAVPSSAWGEKFPLILADIENLPDILFNTGWKTGDLLRYGADEGLLVDIAPYINDQYMPCLASLFADHPEYKTPWTDSEGRVWGVGFINHITRPDERQWHYLNYQWMIDCGLDPAKDLPTTLDEFTDLMRLFKEKKSAELGKEIYPISGMYTGWNSIVKYLLIALGYEGSNYGDGFPGGDINMRNGKVVLPCADREAWEGFLKTMKLWYDEGLVHPEYFTADSKAMDALISAGETGFVTVPPFIWVGQEVEKLGQWWGAPCLTSEWSDTPRIVDNSIVNNSPNHCITTACEELELALAFFDCFYQRGTWEGDQNCLVMLRGPREGTELGDKYPEHIYLTKDEAGNNKWIKPAADYGCVDANDVLTHFVNLYGNMSVGYYCLEEEDGTPIVEGGPEALDLYAKYDGTGVKSWVEIPIELRAKHIQGMSPRAFNAQYQVDPNKEFPTTIYFDADTQTFVDDTKVAMKEYSMTECAKFITGERDLSELPDYFDTMDSLGAAEYVQIHQDYYDAVVGG